MFKWSSYQERYFLLERETLLHFIDTTQDKD